jgi:energy-coupling factor transporter ATP-binding protein EcfA2
MGEGEHTRIRRIQVTKLFGIFDHDIPLNLNDRITIVHGPNGYGKTVILQMIDGLFSKEWEVLRGIPFDELVVELEDGGGVRVRREAPREKRRAWKAPRALMFSYVDEPGAKLEETEYKGLSLIIFTFLVHRSCLLIISGS